MDASLTGAEEAPSPGLYISDSLDFSDWEKVRSIARGILDADSTSENVHATWLENYCAFQDAYLEHGARLYIGMTTDVGDIERKRAYLHFVEKVEPEWQKFDHLVSHKIRSSPLSHTLKVKGWECWLRSLETQASIFHKKNLPLMARLARLAQEYMERTGTLEAEWEGKKVPLERLSAYLEARDPVRREKAWRASASARLALSKRINRLFSAMKAGRHRLARNVGLPNYREYCFRKYERVDYTPQHCLEFHDSVLHTAVPRYREILDIRRRRLGLEVLRPWDLDCSPLPGGELVPFSKVDQLVEGTRRVFSSLDGQFAGWFDEMSREGMLDLENRRAKAPGGYQCTLEKKRVPFIFMNAVGTNKDLFTLFHECGHAFHLFLCRHLEPAFNRSAPMEFSEVASMSMERFVAGGLREFYSEADAARAVAKEEEGALRLLVWVAVVDAFQHWVYTHPQAGIEALCDHWTSLLDRFDCGVQWDGLEDFKRVSWHRQLHIFEYPFYYIEYGIALLGALQFRRRFSTSPEEAIAAYKRALSLGGTQGLRSLFESAGLAFDFSREMMASLVDEAADNWKRSLALSAAAEPEDR